MPQRIQTHFLSTGQRLVSRELNDARVIELAVAVNHKGNAVAESTAIEIPAITSTRSSRFFHGDGNLSRSDSERITAMPPVNRLSPLAIWTTNGFTIWALRNQPTHLIGREDSCGCDMKDPSIRGIFLNTSGSFSSVALMDATFCLSSQTGPKL